MSNKKGEVDLPVRFIVIIILALLFIILGLFFMRSGFNKSSTKLEEMLVAGAPKPQVEIKSPYDGQLIEVKEEVTFEPFFYGQKTRIVAYFWDFDGDGYVDSREEINTFTYFEPGDYKVTLKAVNNLGGLGTVVVTVRVYPKNQKNMTKYDRETAFFIVKKEKTSFAVAENWKEILKLIPLTSWVDKDGDHYYPFVVLAEGLSVFDTENAIIDGLNKHGRTKAVIFFDEEESPPIVVGVYGPSGEYTFETQTMDDDNYFSYWHSAYDSLVLVHRFNYDGALIAALFAARFNAPLVFIDDDNYVGYKSKMIGKTVYVIDKDTFIDAENGDETWGYITGGEVPLYIPYESGDLRNTTGGVDKIIELRSGVLTK
ncbi:MAG: PKD domain-containing protein [Nanoarchaeota archaeon]|nr:PKD domain-containing protein [Nanoarchaeota archaeon]